MTQWLNRLLPFLHIKTVPASTGACARLPKGTPTLSCSALELLQLLHDRCVLELLGGVVSAGDQLVDTLTAAVDNPESLRAIRNFLLLTKVFGSIPPDVLNSVVQTIAEGAEWEQSAPGAGVAAVAAQVHKYSTQPDSSNTLEQSDESTTARPYHEIGRNLCRVDQWKADEDNHFAYVTRLQEK